jgi:subtilisin family serine protease
LTFYLCQGVTKTGKLRYFFAREIKGEAVEQIPEGYAITESVNGVVSLSKAQVPQLRADEIDAVKVAVARHPKRNRYRINARPKRIEIYEVVGPDAETLMASLGDLIPMMPGMTDRISVEMDRYTQYTPVLRFTLIDAAQRTFAAERMCYLGSTGQGVRVAVIDSGVDHDHPALGNSVRGGIKILYDPEAENSVRYVDVPQPRDSFGQALPALGSFTHWHPKQRSTA